MMLFLSSLLFLPLLHALPSSLSRRAAGMSCPVNPTSSSPPPKCNAADPAYTQSESSMYNNIVCPTTPGGTANVKAPYLLVPGTGTTGSQAWTQGYVILLGKTGGLGYDVCYLAEPNAMLKDAQAVDERIAYSLNTLSTIAQNNTIVQGWSQGNLDIQWTLTFWTSSRNNTDRFISLAGDFRGTDLTSLENGLGITLTGGFKEKEKRDIIFPLPPSVHQQLTDGGPSRYLTALANHGGLSAKVPTTSIYSLNDEVISPENDTPTATSYLSNGGSNAPAGDNPVQDYCPGLSVSHGDELWLNVVYRIVLVALSSSTKSASPAMVRAAAIPCNRDPAPGANPSLGDQAIAEAGSSIVACSVNEFTCGTFTEPALRSYATA